VVSPEPDPPEEDCEPCTDPAHFGDSAYVGCCRLKDLKTGEIRRFLYQHPTT